MNGVDEMLVMLDEKIMMHYYIVCLRTLKDNGLTVWTELFREILDYFLFYLWTVLNGTTLD